MARRVVRHLRLAQPPSRVFEACLELLRTADPARGVVARSVSPDPPVLDSVVSTTVRDRHGERSLTATVVELVPGETVATVTDSEPAVRTALHCAPDGAGGTRLTLVSDAEGALSAFGRVGALLDAVLFASGQRRAARATLSRVEELAGRR